MKINNLLLLLMAFLIFILSVSAINAQEIDNSNENLTVSDNSIDVKDDIISSDLSNDEEILGYHDNGQAFYIGFDQEDITVGEGESATITGDILTSGGQKLGYGDFTLAVSVNNVNKNYVNLKNGHFSLSTDGLGLTTSGSLYTIKFTPEESMEYNVEFCEQYEGEVASSWVTVTVANVEPANVVYVDSSYTGSDSDGSKDKPYKKIADGVTNADEGKTVSIANGEYNGEGTITINKNIDIVGESASGVIVNNAIFKYNPTADITSILANLTINGATSATTAAIDIAKKAVALTVNNVNINNWVVEGSDSVIKSQSTSPVVFDNVNILNTKGTATSGTAASSVFLITASTGGATIKNSCINNTQFLGTTNSNGILKCVGSTVNMDNVTVFGTTGRTTGLFHLGSNSAVVDVKNSKILNNAIQGSESTTSAANGVMFYAGGGSSAKANMTVQNSIIKDNIIKNHLVYTSNGIVTLNYNVITNNTQARMSYSAKSSDVFNADYNWWGSNTNPDASKINNVVVMETSATPSTVEYGKNVVIKADFTKFNESGTLSPLAKNIPDAVVVNFNDAVEKTIKDGVATYTVKVTKDNNVFSVTADEEKQSVSVKEKLPVSWDSIYLTENGVVSGSADIISVNPWTTSGSLQYTIPEDVKEIKSAIVVVNSYSGSGNSDNYALHSDVTLTTDTTKTLGSEDLDYSGSQTGDPTVYVINDHTSKQYSDYQYTYDILSDISSLSAGETLTINVANSKLGNKGFDGRIKMISLFIAYDDGDKDNITYFFDVGQVWSQSTSQITLNTAGYSGAVDNITFKTIALSSFVAENIKFNNREASSPSSQYSNNYYIFITWDNISDYFVSGQNLAYSYSASGSGYGSYKTNLILLTATEKYEFVPNISIDSIKTPESNSIYAGINNTITVTINNKESESVDNITVELYSNESSELIANYTYDSLTSGSSSIALEDPTVRPITENTVLPAANNNKIEYTVNIKYNDNIIATTTASRKVVYNGYLNKTYAFEGHENIINRNYTISGDVIISTQDVSKYAAANSKSREETWNIETPEGAEVTNVFLYFPYNWDASYFPDGWTLTFNGNDISSNIINHERDKSNIGYRGDNVYYGLVVFDVTSYYLPNDNNTFNIQKTGECALYPSTLVVLYNVTGTKTIKDVYFSDVCDVFYPYYNKVGYDDAIKAFINYDDINIDNITNAVWYSFTGSSSSNVDLSFNNEIITNAFDGYSSNDCKAYEFDVTDIIGTNNEARYITKAQTSTAVAYEQILVVTRARDLPTAETTVKSEYTSVPSIYAGVNNTLTVTVKNSGKSASDVVVTLLIGDEVIGTQTLADYESGETYTLTFVDTTIRPITENTVNGNDNENVVYTVAVKDNGGNLINETNSSFVVLYNGNLGKDFEYPNANPLLREYTITGDVIIGGGSQYAASSDNVNDIISVEFDGDVAEALLYVSYNWNNPSLGDFTSWNITFNDKIIAPIASYKDQGNLGNYGKYSYGLVVYNVTDLVVNGNNALSINRTAKNVAVYPASLLVLTNKESSLVEKTVYIWEETDLLSKSYNKNLPAGFNTSFDVVDGNATLYVFAASAEKNEGNLIINGENNTDVWKGTSKSVEMYSADVDAGHIDVYFESTGATILALHQIVVVSNEVLPEIDVSAVKTPWSSGIYAGVENNLTVTINNKESIVLENVTIEIYSNETGDVIATQTIDSLAPGETTIVINDPTIRELTENTVWPGAQNNKIKYNINVKYADSDIINKSFDKIVAYNGYLNKTYAYDGSDNKINRNYTITGDVIVSPQPTDVYMDQFSRQRTETWNISVPDDSTLVKAFLYFNYNWDTSFFPEGWTLTFNGNDITEKYIFWDIDQGNLGGWGIYQYGSLVFDVSDYFVNGENTFNITKTGNCALYPSTLVVLYNTTASKTIKDVYFSDICDVLYGYYNKEYANETNVYVPFNGIDITDIQDASWYVFAGSADGKHDGNISFNDKVFSDLWDEGSSNSCYPYIANVTDVIGENNDAWYLTNPKLMSTVVVYEQILVVTRAKELPGAETSLKTEYANTIYAGVVNNLTLTVKNTGISAENVVVRVLIGDEEIGSETIAKYDANESYTLNIIDSTIRPVTENTVNGNNNEKVNYTVIVENDEGIIIDESNYTVVVLYNGNLGKDFEYPNANSTLREFTVTGDVIVVTTEEYSAGAATNRTDVFDVALNDDVVSDALLYVSYNWDKIANGDFNTWITTFNGQTITPIASYRDQSNLGNYGKYGYGLVVYNVTGLVVDGVNTFVLNKTKGNAAVYPSTLIVLTNAENSSIEKTVYILEEADLLSKSNNKNLDAGFNTIFDVIDGNATLFVFAASAQSGEGNLIINGETNTDVWNGTSNSVEAFIANVTSGNIKIYFESTGATILALQQMVVVENIIPEVIKQNATIVIDAPEITEGENATITVTVENATGDVTITVGNITKTDSLIDGKVIFVIPDLSKGNYTIDVAYAGDDKYNSAEDNVTVTVNPKQKADSNINVSAEDITEGEVANVIVSLPGDATGNVTVILNGESKVININDTTVRGLNGVLSMLVTYNDLVADNYTVVAIYSGDDKYNPSNATAVFEVAKASKENATIDVTAEPITEGENVTVVVTLPEDASGNVTVGNTTVPVVNGSASVPVSGLAVGNTTLLVVYSGDDKYNPAEDNVTITVNPKEEPVPSKENATMDVVADKAVEDENSTIAVNLPKDATGNVTAVVEGNPYTAPVVNGTATISIPGLRPGNYTAHVTYSGDDKYNPASKDIPYEVEEADKSDIVSAPDVTKYYGGSERFVVNVTDSEGNPVANKSVTIVINGRKYDRTTKADGTTSIGLSLNSGVYNATVTVDNKTINSVVTILSTVNGTDVVKVFRNATQYYATFRDSEGNYLKEGTVVTFNINGVMYERKISGNEGLAKLNLNLGQGSYVITAMNPETGENAANNITIIARLIENRDITKYYRNATQYTVKVIGDDGKAVGAGESVTFNINGVFYTRQTNESGIAKLNLNLQPGDYIITAEYKNCKVSNKIKVLPVLSAKDISMKYRDGTKFVATLVDGQGKVYASQTIQFNINGVFYNRVTDSSGQAKLNINLQAGQYIITSSYNGANIANTVTVSA